MNKHLLSALAALLFCTIASLSIEAQTNAAVHAADVKQDVKRHGRDANVIVSMKSGTKLRGRIDQIRADSFDLKGGSNKLTNVLYSEVGNISMPRVSLATRTSSLVLLGVGVAVIVGIVAGKSQKGTSCFGCGPLF